MSIKSTTDNFVGKPGGNVELTAPTLTEVEKRALYAEAIKAVEEELKDKESERLLAEYKKHVRQALVPEEKLEPVLIDLAGHSAKIVIDGVQYFHGVTYRLSGAQATTVREVIYRTWKHEAEIGGANSNMYRKPRHVNLGPSDAGASLSHLMRM